MVETNFYKLSSRGNCKDNSLSFLHYISDYIRPIYEVGLSKLENGRNRFHFTLSQELRATRGLVPNLQLPWWCYIEKERTIWEWNGLIETPDLQGRFANWSQERSEFPRNFLIERPPRLCCKLLGLAPLSCHFCLPWIFPSFLLHKKGIDIIKV